MTKPIVDFPVFDADNHMYENTDAFTQFLPKEYEGLVKYVQVNGRTKIAVRNVISDYIPNPTFEVVGRPGASEELFKHGNPEGKTRREIIGKPIRSPEAFFSPEPRLKLMDELGLDRALMWPTLASLLEERLDDDPVATHVVIHALNQWMHEHWTFDYEGRIFPSPVITLPDRQRGHQGARVGRRARRQTHPDPARTGSRLRRPALVRTARVRPVLGEGRRGGHHGRYARVGRRADPLLQPVGREPPWGASPLHQ